MEVLQQSRIHQPELHGHIRWQQIIAMTNGTQRFFHPLPQ